MSEASKTAAITEFSCGLQQQLRKKNLENVVYSPLGVTLCCSLAYIGAEENTQLEMATALNYPADDETPFPSNLMKLLNVKIAESFTLTTAQQVFIQKGYDILPEYLKKLKKMNAGLGHMDYREAQRSCNEVNTWVRKATNGEIKEIMQPGDFKKELSLILINTVYFHGKWEVQFKEENTEPKTFFFKKGEARRVPMMNLRFCQTTVQYVNCKKLDAEIIKLPYKGKRFSMVVIIPNVKNGLSDMEERMLDMSVEEYLGELNDFKKKLSTCILNVTVPKFEFDSDLDLLEPLKQLGIQDAFSMDKADFSGISDDPFGLFISKVIQKAMIKVDEEGTTAAAATEIDMIPQTRRRKEEKPKRIINFVADHPFYFQVIEEKMKIVLFAGVVTDPRKKPS